MNKKDKIEVIRMLLSVPRAAEAFEDISLILEVDKKDVVSIYRDIKHLMTGGIARDGADTNLVDIAKMVMDSISGNKVRPKRVKTTYTDQQKEQIIKLVTTCGSVSDVAKANNINVSTLYNWLRIRDIKNKDNFL